MHIRHAFCASVCIIFYHAHDTITGTISKEKTGLHTACRPGKKTILLFQISGDNVARLALI
ncbi:MAG: hypothetical protein IKM64_07635, partial [Clostridia bacterium]|nr:hypothetical protein [Clostridia bacterium]